MKWRRILMKAMAAYEEAGGKLYKDLDSMKGALATRRSGGQPIAGFSADHLPDDCPTSPPNC